jgi:hypothetical protein
MTLRFKRHYTLLVALALISAVLILDLDDQPIVAYTAPSNVQMMAGVNTFAGWLTEDLLSQQAPLAWAPGLMDLFSP